MRELHELIERVAALTEPDREVDAEIDIALFGGETVWKTARWIMEAYPASRRPSKHHVGGFANEHVPLVTGSTDAAIALTERVLPGWGWDLASNTEHIKACLNPEYGEPIGKHPHWAAVANTSAKTFHDGATPAIALTLATLKALAAREGAE